MSGSPRLLIAGLIGVALAGCAPPSSYQAPTHVVLAEGEGAHVERLADGSISDTVSLAPGKALAGLRAAYGALGLQVNVYDPAEMLVGVSNRRVIHRLNGAPLSRFVDCGSMMTGQRANDWWVYITATSKVSASGGGSQVATRLDVFALDPTGSSERIPCGSTGALEAQLVQAVRQASSGT